MTTPDRPLEFGNTNVVNFHECKNKKEFMELLDVAIRLSERLNEILDHLNTIAKEMK